MNIEWEKEHDAQMHVYTPYIDGKKINGCWVQYRHHAKLAPKVNAAAKGYYIYEGDDLTEGMIQVTRAISDLGYHKGMFDDVYMNKFYFGPTDKDIIGWKKAYCQGSEVIVKLRIPAGSLCNIMPLKCRAEKAEVLAAYYMSYTCATNEPHLDKPVNITQSICPMVVIHNHKLRCTPDTIKLYHVGDILRVEDFGSQGLECAPGIHFFKNIKNAMYFRFM